LLIAGKSIPVDTYWTSASDEGCEKSFGWCAVNKLVRNGIWASGQPDNAGGKENCLGVALDKAKAEILDEDCTKLKPYICEVSVLFIKLAEITQKYFKARDTTKSTTAGKAIKNECAAAYNVSECTFTFFNIIIS